MTDAITREEKLMEAIATGSPSNIKPITREEMFLAKAGGQDVETPEPITRREKFLQGIIDNGGGGGFTDIGNTITWDGTPTDTSMLVEEGLTLYHVTDAVPTGVITTGTIVASLGEYNLPPEVAVVATDGNVIVMQGETNPLPCFIALEDNASCSLIEGLVLPKKGVWLPFITPEGVTVGSYVSSLTISEGTFVVQSGGGIKPEGTITITENGTHDVAEYASAEVNVASGGEGESSQIDALINGSITEITSNVESVNDYGLYGCDSLKKINLPNVISVGLYGVGFCSNLTEVEMPNLVTTKSSAFNKCSKIKKLDFNKLETIGSGCFYRCNVLDTLIIRTNKVCTLSSKDALQREGGKSKFEDGSGYIYVPRSLVDSYKTATNWSTYASQFRALEDYTVDGTITGELDESKI